jgi:cell division cycle protein 37
MSKGFNYSKWDNIELSDDESDLHPNIDKDSWFRMKHRSRLEREEREDKEVQGYIQKNSEDNSRLNIVNARIKAVQNGGAGAGEDAEFEDVEALLVEKRELEAQVAGRNKRIAEINERRSWNMENICKVKEEKTVVNDANIRSLNADISLVDPAREEALFNPPSESDKPVSAPETVFSKTATPAASSSTPAAAPAAKSAAKAPTPAAAPAPIAKGAEPAAGLKRERLAVISYNDYVLKHERLLEDYSEISDMEATKNFLFKNCDILLHEHAQSYMLLSCLEDEMNGKKKRMRLVCRQSQILSHIHDLGVSMKRDPRDVILPFFIRIEEKEHFAGFTAAVDDFILRIQKRAVEKRKEMDLERAREIREQHVASGEKGPLGPGGLDPFEVLESLPVELRDAFESQDLDTLQAVLAHMAPKDAKHWMKQCVDSGLWVPQDQSIFENEAELDAAESDEEEGDSGNGQPAGCVEGEARVKEIDD